MLKTNMTPLMLAETITGVPKWSSVSAPVLVDGAEAAVGRSDGVGLATVKTVISLMG